jgi:Tfp pilus assembly protein FimT
MRPHNGHSLIELTIALLICAILAGTAVPPLLHGRRVLAVRAAAAELAGLLAVARATAIESGGATLVLDVAAASAWTETDDGTRIGDIVHIGARHGVALEADRSSPVRIRYDALGIGRFAAASLRVRSGRALAALTVSAYGRVRL